MRSEKFNSEGYYDPTPYEALANIFGEQRFAFRPIVYICSPYAGDVEGNGAAARKYCRFAVDTGHIPLAVHLLYPQFMDDNDPKERALGMFFGSALMSKCAEVWVFGKYISPGMQEEISRACRKNIPVRYFTEECQEATE